MQIGGFVLQRGRVEIDAEGEKQKFEMDKERLLQRGRVEIDAEGVLGDVVGVILRTASTGPRRDRRGRRPRRGEVTRG